MNNKLKLRPLYVAKILYDMTDEDHCLSTPEIISILKEKYGVDGYRTTVASDIEALIEFGMEIETVKSSSNLYHLISREFDIPEIKLLIDAVESSKFITEKKSQKLVSKLGNLVSQNQAEILKRNLVPEGRIKPDNEYIYYIVDAINEAINSKKKISFKYYEYDITKKQKPRHNGEVYVFSPYNLVWNGDYYYMVGFSDKHNNISSFRLDRISKQPNILDEDIVPMPKSFNLSDFINSSFRMFNSEHQDVELICDNEVIDSIIDRFGDEIEIKTIDDKSFSITVNIAVSHIFYSWVFGFGGSVRINSPETVKEHYKELINNAKC